MQEQNFWCCGGRKLYWDMAKKLAPGDEICAYTSGKGYVGVGVIIKPAQPIDGFLRGRDEGTLEQATIDAIHANASRPPESQEYAVEVRWDHKAPPGRPWRWDGCFASPMTLCSMREQRDTLRALRAATIGAQSPD